ncbi:MAG: hypothetical protein JNM62_16160 [Flavobacteriales bacterium]|nr:hypothetical protein [Flavobacteriales bacterium]
MEGPRYAKATSLLGEERLINFLRAAALQGADPGATWKAAQLSARTFSIQCGSGRSMRRWRTSFRACGKVQLLKEV